MLSSTATREKAEEDQKEGQRKRWDKHTHIHPGYFYSASSSLLLLRGAPDTARILRRSFMPKRHRQLWGKDLPKVPMWWKVSNLPMSHHAPHIPCIT